jgi:hypothetical protein
MNLLETELGVELPIQFQKYDIITQQLVINYIKQMNSIEKLAYKIGKEHLGSSFNILKSNGYNNWKKQIQ